MKKLFTLLFAFGAVATSFAQTRDDAKDIILGKKKDGSDTNKPVDKRNDGSVFGKKEGGDVVTYPSGTSSEQQARIDQVNREYDAKIQSIRNNPTLSEEEKARAIAQLNKDRARKIREIRGESRTDTGKHKKGHDRDDDDEDDDHGNNKSKSKGNNGNHYGWEKGKGNPHKNGGKPGKKG